MPNRIPLEGKTFGRLYVESYLGNFKYHCRCSCGKECDVSGYNLRSGHTKSCGCAKENDLTGKVFGHLKVIERSEPKARGKKLYQRWKCQCLLCGNIVDVYSDCLISGQNISCGCFGKNRDIPDSIRHAFVDGTQIDKIKSIPTASNKSGVVGVNWDKSRGKWQASIRFKGHKYNLGRFSDFEDACKARKDAEDAMFGEFLKWYEENQKKPR